MIYRISGHVLGQVIHSVDKDRKRELLSHLVKSGKWQQVLVFCRTKHGANRLAEQLEHDGIEASAIHGNKSQPQRTKTLKRFKDCELQVLVATDIASRGLDIDSLPHVVNYDLPHVSEDYVHRIGRTGRAGEAGQAVSLVSGEDRTLLRDIERLIGKKIDQQIIPGFEVGSGYHSAQPEPQGRRGQRPQNQPRRPERSRSAQQNQGNGQRRSQPSSFGRGSERNDRGRSSPPPSGRGRERSEQARTGRPPQRQAAPALPQEKIQQSVRQEQLEYHRNQQADEHRSEAAPTNERGKDKAVPALFGLVGRKVI